MKMYDLNYKFDDGKDYYYLVIDLVSSNYFMIKNPSCLASIENYVSDMYNLNHWDNLRARFKFIFNGNSSLVDIKLLPKKYQKFIKREDLNV